MWEVLMKPCTFLILPAILLFLLFVAMSMLGQEQTKVKVTGTEVVTGVVIVDIVMVKEGRYCEVRCNQGAYQCKPLKSGYYVMVELPKNFGMYECKNVEIYAGDIDSRGKLEKMGEYCLTEK